MLSSVRFSIVMLCLLAIGSFVGGCATMANTDQQIAVYTIPDGADVVVGDNKGVSPMSVTVPGGYSIPHSIQISKEGFQSKTVTIQRGFRTSALVTDILLARDIACWDSSNRRFIDGRLFLRGENILYRQINSNRDWRERQCASSYGTGCWSNRPGQIRYPLAHHKHAQS